MNILQWFGIGKAALADKSAVESVVKDAKVMIDPDGVGPLQPKPAYKTTEFWIFKVLPLMTFLVESMKGFVPPMWYTIAILAFAAVAFMSREALKIAHLWASRPAGEMPNIDTTELAADVQRLVDAFKAGKLAISTGKTDDAAAAVDNLNRAA